MSVPQALRAYALSLLKDGRWHDRLTVVEQLATKVPPGYATRVAAAARLANTQYRARREGKSQPEVTTLNRQSDPAGHVGRGSRIAAARALDTAAFETRTLASGVKQVRITP